MNAKAMDKSVVKRRVKSALLACLGGLVAALELACLGGLAVGAHAAPPRGHSPASAGSLRAVPEEIVLRGTDSEGNELALRVPVNILMPRLGERARPGELARLGGLAQLQEPGNNASVNLNQIGGGSVSSALYDSGNTALKVNCIVGCSAAGSFTDNNAFTTGSTSVTNVSGLFNDTATNLTSGNAGAIRATTDRMLFVNIGKIGGTVPALTGSSLNVNCTGGCSSSAGFADNSAFTAGTTTETNVGGVFNDGLTALTSGNAAAARITPNRGVHVNLRNNSGTEIATSANPLRIDPTGTTTQPVSGTVTANAGTGTFNIQANASTNVAQFGGTNTVTGTGASGAGIPRVTISNDSSLAANQSVNLAQVGGTNTVNGGTAGTLGVGGNLSSNGAAAATNRVGTLDGIAQTSYNNGTASTQGRDVAPNVGTDGLLWTAALPAMRPASYHASAIVASAATATDIATMPGNATNTVLVTGIRVSCTQTTGSIINLSILMRTTADTAGTPVTTTIHKDDSNYAAASSAPKTWTANPTKGTLEAMVDSVKLGCMAPGTVSPNDIYISPSNWRMKPMVLRGTAQELEVNLGTPIDGTGTTVTGGSFLITFEWIETATITP